MNEFVLYNGAYSGPQVDAAVSRALSGGALDQAIAALRAAVGSPLVAATVAEMTDINKVYVYTGSEAGYTAGDWYYWNGSAWTSGGAYNSAAADAAMSDSSTNAVQNKVIKAAIDAAEAAAKDAAYDAYPTETDSGAAAATEIGADNIPLKSLMANIVATQGGSGTPSPSNIRPISGSTGMTLTRTGKNLLDPSLFADTTESAGIYTKGSEYTELNHGNPIFLLAGSYVCSFNDPGGDFSKVSWSTVNGAVGEAPFSVSGDGYSGCSFTLAEAAYVYILAGACSFSEPQLEAGSARSNYVPYNGDTYTISWQNAAGTVYGGTLDVLTGLLTVNYAKQTFDGTQSLNETNGVFFWYSSIIKQGSHVSDPQVISSYLPNRTGNVPRFTQSNNNNNRNIFFYNMSMIDASLTTVAALSAYFEEHPLDVVFEREPVTYQLTKAQVNSILGENHIYSDTGNVSATFRCDPTLALEQLRNAVLSLGNNT